MTRKQIIEIFQALTLSEKESLLTELQTMVTIEKNSPPKSPLEIAWKEIQRNIKMLSFYSYIDDQIEIIMIWDICEDLIKSDVLKNEAWDLKEKILKEIIQNDFFDYYSIFDPMKDLMEALCTTTKENLLCADLIYQIGSGYIKQYGAKIYKQYGKPEKYYDYLEQCLNNNLEPYLELIEYYRNINADKAAEIAELGLKKCHGEQTELFIYLIQYEQMKGNEENIARLIRSAKNRKRRVDVAKYRNRFFSKSNDLL